MGKGERVIVSVFVCVIIPLSFFFAGWWGSALLGMPEGAITRCAFGGLALGIAVVVLRLRWMVAGFYRAPTVVVLVTYLLGCVVALGLLMGVPIGVIVVGVLAGLYTGRRACHHNSNAMLWAKTARAVGLFTATVTGVVCVAMGLLAIEEQRTMQAVLSLVGVEQLAATVTGRIVLVCLAVPGLTVLQYWLTKKTATLGLQTGAAAS